jgi:phosphatidylinositol alpha 1,6-mannosyltransferase
MRPTRYVVVTESFAPRLDEVADTARHLVDGLVEAGDEVLVVTHGSGAPSYRGVPVIRPRRRVPAREVATVLTGFRPDGVVALAPHVLGGLALRHASRGGIPSTAIDPVSLQERADVTLATTRGGVADLLVAGVGPELWLPGVDLAEHHPGLRDPGLRAAWAGDAELVVGHSGPLDRHKVIARLRRIAALDRIRLVVFGSGPGADDLRDRGALISTAVSGLDLARSLASVDVVVQARGHDRAVPGVRKALASGIPVVGFDAGGTRDVVVHRHNGLLAAPGDDRGLARLVDHLRRHRPLLEHLAGAARPSVAWRTWADALAELRLDHLRPRPSPVHL